MTNYKQEPMKAAILLQQAVEAMLDAANNERFLDAIDSTDNFPLSYSFDAASYIINDWVETVKRKMTWQPPTDEDLKLATVASIGMRSLAQDLQYCFSVKYPMLANEIAQTNLKYLTSIEDLLDRSKNMFTTVNDVQLKDSENLAADIVSIICHYLEGKKQVNIKEIDRTSPISKLRMIINSLNSLTSKVDYFSDIYIAVQLLQKLVDKQTKHDNEEDLSPQTEYRQHLMKQGWSEENTGGGCMVWYKDFTCTDSKTRVVGIDGEAPEGCLYPVNYNAYFSTEYNQLDNDNEDEPTSLNDKLYTFQQLEIATANEWIQLLHGFRI